MRHAKQSLLHAHGYIHNLPIATQLTRLLGGREAHAVTMSAEEVNSLDRRWNKRFEQYLSDSTDAILKNAQVTGRLKLSDVDFAPLTMEHSLAVMEMGLTHSRRYVDEDTPDTRLAKGKPREARVPTNFKKLREMWDHYRKMKVIPKRQQSMADRIKDAYLKRVQDEWIKHGDAFRSGSTAVKDAAIKAIKEGAAVSYSRAKMIVETETTYYYNKTRVAVYDQSPDVSHYLFMAIRDHRTTEWCKTRHGLVYAKDSTLFKMNRPPCHWYCRSEIIPLTPANPRHLILIRDAQRDARYAVVKPLPPEWSGERKKANAR